MNRADVVQGLLNLYEAPHYLEIGVQHGHTFHALKAARRVAVDPDFLFDAEAAGRDNSDATYHEIPSDDYFSRVIGAEERFDVIFIDGLHTFDQTLRDLLNAIEHMTPNGIIVLDDVIPVNYMASLPTLEKAQAFQRARGIHDAAWMGDVFRMIFFIRDYLRHWSYATTTELHGLAVLWRAPRPTPPAPLDIGAIMRLDYSDVVFGMDSFNLRPFATIEAEVRAAIAGQG